jgi:tartrate dehydratase alpha subunit/fumarate hydratase class I-like protein
MENTKMNEMIEESTSKKGLGVMVGLGVAGAAAVGAIVARKLLKKKVEEADVQEEVVEDNKKSKAK